MMGSGSQGRIRGYGRGSRRNTVASPLTINETKTASEAYLVRLNNSDLELAEVMV